MPKIVDHAERRVLIIEGLVRLAGREGLHAVTMRSVAAEAGVSLRVVQYYFDGKAELMHAALKHLERRSSERWADRMARSPRPETTRAYVEELLEESFPTTEQSRTFRLVWTSYAVLAMTDPDLAAKPFVEGPNRFERQLAEVLEEAQEDGELDRGLDVTAEAARLLGLSHGLGTSVLVGQRTAEDAKGVLKYHLDGVFGPGGPPAPPAVSAGSAHDHR
ncbi:TetR/AcrR family transcriptional regulator [Streptomyces arenae]|nr:TetR/AcrR family transcriptional regulator [Streptomyces arenae]